MIWIDRSLLAILLSFVPISMLESTAWSASSDPRPDVMLILLDDSGWTDFGCYGSEILTPSIDTLASEGMRFTDCHSAAPNCSPSRAGLLTGRTPPRIGIYSYLPSGHVMHLPDEEITIAERLKELGYKTGHFGKWHLSRLRHSQPQPADQGFDYSLGTDNNASPSHWSPKNFIRNGEPVGETKGYSCQIVVDEAVNWLKSVKESDPKQPTFSCIWFHEPHTPIASPAALIERYKRMFPGISKKQATYYANINNVDNAVGRLMEQIDALGMRNNTFVFLTSDNGPLNAHSKQGLRGKKSHVWEGGHRVPGIFRWPGKIEAGSVSEEPICGVDFFPTVCDLTGVGLPTDRTIDGTSVLPILTGESENLKRQNPLYWFFYRLNPAIAMREGPWVLIAETNDATRPKAHALLQEDIDYIKSSRPESFELFRLSDDLPQQADLAQQEPAVLERMKKRLEAFHADVVSDGVAWEIPTEYGEGSKKQIWNSR